MTMAFVIGCDDEGDDGGVQQPPPVNPPVEPLDSIGLELIAEDLTSPVLLVEAPDSSGRLFIVDQVGVIRVIDGEGQMAATPFLDLRDRIVELMPEYDERGLLGLAFHPDFASNGRLFVYYSGPLREEAPDDYDHTNYVAELFVSPSDPDLVDVGSERILLAVDHPQFNHNGGMLAFGPDGQLYISIGDGGNANDVGVGHSPLGNGQDLDTLLGKILRIDVDGETPYSIPGDNPFVGSDGLDEIYAYGFRNPFRFSFDLEGGELFVGDAGQDRVEEVSIVELGGNYGWNIKEGSTCFDPQAPETPPTSCTDVGANGDPLVDPILEYPNTNAPGGLGLVVIGGYVYRGTGISELEGEYIFGDFSSNFDTPSGLVFAAREGDDGAWEMRQLEIANGALGEFVRGFGQDESGEIYLLSAGAPSPTGQTGRVYRIVPSDQVPPPPTDQVAAQIAEGATLFAENCARCHGDDGKGTTIAPPLVGQGALPRDPPPDRQLRDIPFVTAFDVFEFVSTFMPYDVPGSLSTETYLAILAFDLHANGIELSEPLSIENAETIVINPPEQ
jgi:glucose/arabinose dehydrogenase/cytochrome c553